MIRIISALLLAVTAAVASAADVPRATDPIEIADGAPQRYTVVKGDTLWDISGRFLKKPWRWPEIWRLNRAQIKNPHWIYPGDVIVLTTGADGQPQLTLERTKLEPRVYVDDPRQQIPSIPANVIEPFLTQPLVADTEALAANPRIIATQEDRFYLGNGDSAYVSGADAETLNWQVYRPGKALVDPATGETLGYEAQYLGTATQVQAGDPATFRITTVKQEIGRGDRLQPTPRADVVAYVPHRPEAAIDARILAVYGGTREAGKHSVISLNKGKRDGLDVGSVLALYRNAEVRAVNEEGQREVVKLPPERYGLVFVFRTFDRVAYALVVNSSRSVIVNDTLRNP